MSRRAARALIAAAVAGATAGGTAGCGVQVEFPEGLPACGRGGGPVSPGVILMAQSVSTATWVPCFVDVPPGWSFAGLQAGQGSAETWLDSDREGTKAVDVRLAPSCDTSGATAAPSGHPGTSRYDRMVTLDPALEFRRSYVFEGGCVTITLTLGGEEHSEAVALATTGIELVPRRDLQQQVREQTGGRLTLDPEEAP